jgi:hypothetical protein
MAEQGQVEQELQGEVARTSSDVRWRSSGGLEMVELEDGGPPARTSTGSSEQRLEQATSASRGWRCPAVCSGTAGLWRAPSSRWEEDDVPKKIKR